MLRLETLAACLADLARVAGTYSIERKKGIRVCGQWTASHVALAHAAGRLAARHPSEQFAHLAGRLTEISVTETTVRVVTDNDYRYEITRVRTDPTRSP